MVLFNLLFLFFASLTLISAICVINVKNYVHSVLFLILTFFGATGLLLLLGVEFFAMLFLIVYVGAVAVLFLFAVMMISKQEIENQISILQYSPMGLMFGFIFLIEMSLMLFFEYSVNTSLFKDGVLFSWSNYVVNLSHISTLGHLLYTTYFFYFIIVGIILFIAMIGSIILTIEIEKNEFVLFQHINQQLSHSFVTAVFLTRIKN